MTFYNGNEKIIMQCFENNGMAFEDKMLLTRAERENGIVWNEEYISEKKLFKGCYWIPNPKATRDAGADRIEKILKISKNHYVPNSIKCTETKTVIKDETVQEPPYAGVLAVKRYNSKLKICVGEQYSSEIMRQYDGSKIVIINNCGSSIVNDTDLTMDDSAVQNNLKIFLDRNENILNELFIKGANKFNIMTADAFVDELIFDSKKRYALEKCGLQPLQNIEQIIGLLAAVCEYSQNKIPDNQIWFIYPRKIQLVPNGNFILYGYIEKKSK